MPWRTIQAGSFFWIGSPRYTTLPFCGSMMPEMVFRMVDLPAPLAPSTVTMLPLCTLSETPRMAFTGP